MTATTSAERTRKTWISILIAAAVIIAIGCVLLVGGGIYIARRYMASTTIAAPEAGAMFEAARAKLENAEPLLEVRGDELVVNRTPDRPSRELSAMHVLAYDPDAGRMVNVTVPGWLLRFVGRGRARINVNDSDLGRHLNGQVSLDDLQHHGPGLVIDTTEPDGKHVLVWTE
jgi:hypothetical protein